jgi:DNA-binding NarL/FixJ family response regulator
MSGISPDTARAVRDARPKVTLVFLTMHKDEHFLNQALDLNRVSI